MKTPRGRVGGEAVAGRNRDPLINNDNKRKATKCIRAAAQFGGTGGTTGRFNRAAFSKSGLLEAAEASTTSVCARTLSVVTTSQNVQRGRRIGNGSCTSHRRREQKSIKSERKKKKKHPEKN